MKTILEVCMYSGGMANDPRVEIPSEDVIILKEKINKLNKVKLGSGGLGADSFAVIFNVIDIDIINGFNLDMLNIPDIVYFHCWPGLIHMQRKDEPMIQSYQDTENIHSFLQDFAAPAIKQHYDNAKKEYEDYFKKFFSLDNLGIK